MAKIPPEQIEALSKSVAAHDFLHRLVEELEALHRLVFHADSQADWGLVRKSAEQILIADVVTRYGGDIQGVYQTLVGMRDSGRDWEIAIRELAGRMHSYYTTPLGFIIRKDLFGDQCVFFSPDAHSWIDRRSKSRRKAATTAN